MIQDKQRSDTLRILFLEDSSRDAEIIREQLSDGGVAPHMDWASSEDEFTTLLKNASYDVVLADYRLVDFDAPAALRLTQKLCPGLPFICVSGAVGEEVAVELLKLGAVDYVLKDRLERLPYAVERAIDDARARAARERAEEELLKKQYYLSKAMELGKIGAWEFDFRSNRLTWTEENYKIFGITPGVEMNYESCINCVHPDDREYVERQWQGVPHSKNYDIELRIIAGGKTKWIREKAELECDAQGNPLLAIGFTHDITEQKIMTELREELNRQLNTKVKELEQVVYVASHDLRSPLVTIEGFCGVLEESLHEISSVIDKETLSKHGKAWLEPFFKDGLEALQYISKAVSSMEGLLRGLLQISRLGREEIKKEPLDMSSLVSDVLKNFKYQRETQGIRIEVTKLPDCQGDGRQISQLFGNLVGNAIKYCKPDQPCVIRISGQQDGEKAVYCVEDNGVGIAPEYQETIFSIFHQLNPDMNGEGLGLSIVKKVVENHGGKVWVESEEGRGSRFYISL